MQAFIWYLLKVGICIAAFWLLYRLLLSRDTFHGLNRAVLLASAVLAFLIPAGFVTLPADAPGPEPYTAIIPIGDEFRTIRTRTAPTPEPLPEPQAAEPDKPVSAEHRPLLPTLIACLFWSGAAVSLLRMLASVTEILRTVRGGEWTRLDRHTVLVHTADHTVPFNWMRYIVLPRSDRGEYEEQIIAHEREHLRLHHSWDLLLLDAAGCLQWFNPFMRLLRRELQDIHEYEADRAVLRAGFNPKEYQMLLIKKAAGAGRYSVADGLGHSNLKKRITMMLKKDSGSRARWKVLAMLPLACLALTAFAQREHDGKDNTKVAKTNWYITHWETPAGAYIKQTVHIASTAPTVTPPYLMVDINIIDTPYSGFEHPDNYEISLFIAPADNDAWSIPGKRFYIDLRNMPENFEMAFSDIPELTAKYLPEVTERIPDFFRQAPTRITIARHDGAFQTTADLSGIPSSLYGMTTDTYHFENAEDLYYVDMDEKGNISVDGIPVTIDALTEMLKPAVTQATTANRYIHVVMNPQPQTPWGTITRFQHTLRSMTSYFFIFSFRDNVLLKGGINKGIESSEFLNLENPLSLPSEESEQPVPYYVYFTHNYFGTTDADKLRNNVIEITAEADKIFVNGTPTTLRRLTRTIQDTARKAGKSLDEMLVGIKTDNATAYGIWQQIVFQASALEPKWLVTVYPEQNFLPRISPI